MGIVVLLLILLLLFAFAVWLTFSLVGLIVTLFVAGLVGWLADQIVPGKLPYGWLGAIVAGLLGSWVGSLLLGDLGPTIARVAIIPALIGAIVLAFVAQLVGGVMGNRR